MVSPGVIVMSPSLEKAMEIIARSHLSSVELATFQLNDVGYDLRSTYPLSTNAMYM